MPVVNVKVDQVCPWASSHMTCQSISSFCPLLLPPSFFPTCEEVIHSGYSHPFLILNVLPQPWLVTQVVECCPMHWKFTYLVPGQGICPGCEFNPQWESCRRQLIGCSLSYWCSSVSKNQYKYLKRESFSCDGMGRVRHERKINYTVLGIRLWAWLTNEKNKTKNKI